MWQGLYDGLKDKGFTVIAAAMDSDPEAARPWVEEAKPSYPAPIDREHLLADLYNMVNVPQAVWIDEQGRIARPTEVAGAVDAFRSIDRETGAMPEEAMALAKRTKAAYVEAVRDWALNGEASRHALSGREAQTRMPAPGEDVLMAHAHFRLGLHLLRRGRESEAAPHLAEAKRLHPASWNMWRETYPKNARGLAAGPEFWERVDALGDRRYYGAIAMDGMP